ncbi:hypothetical protein BDW74DRAFT_163588 [Aspergillus multicolor]|uniref:uncharacterized protein n=1 Tax=Aspergillus multicolor TaxID=41759 RepID=UPI003CCE22F7
MRPISFLEAEKSHYCWIIRFKEFLTYRATFHPKELRFFFRAELANKEEQTVYCSLSTFFDSDAINTISRRLQSTHPDTTISHLKTLLTEAKDLINRQEEEWSDNDKTLNKVQKYGDNFDPRDPFTLEHPFSDPQLHGTNQDGALWAEGKLE